MRHVPVGWKRPYALPLGHRVRELREARGWNTHELGRRSGLTGSQVRKLESGVHAPRRATLEKLAQALELAVSELLPDMSSS